MRSILSSVGGAGAVALALVVGTASCGSDPVDDSGSDGRPTVAVTTSVWGDIVTESFGDLVDVEVILPVGVDPHDFAPSARQAERMENADLVVVNGLGLEAAMADVVDRVSETGTPVVALAGGDATAAPVAADDPHIWLDPIRVAAAVETLGDALVAEVSLDRAAVEAAMAPYLERLAELDAELAAALSRVPADRRFLVTNHDEFGYFADRYGYEVVGTVIPSISNNAAVSAAGLAELADLIERLAVPAIFAETTTSDDLARALADEVGGDVAVVQLYSASLGEPGSGAESYVGLMTTNATRIADALT